MSEAGSPTDAEIIESSLVEPERFGVLFDLHAGVVHGYLARRVGGLADDLLSEVFLLAFERRGTFRPESTSARPWLLGIASNLVARAGRAEAIRYRALARRDADELSLPDSAERSVARVDAERMAAPIARCLARLAARDRDVLLLIAWGDLSYTEVAEALGIPVGTVRSRLNRARAQIRPALAEPTTRTVPRLVPRES